MWKVREIADKVTNVVLNYTETESKVREATNDEPWGPTGAQLQELTTASFNYEQFPELMSMLWKRITNESKSNYIRIYKALIILNHLILNGTDRTVNSAREHRHDLLALENFNYIDDQGKDQGINVRHRARKIITLIESNENVRAERTRAREIKEKLDGIQSNVSSQSASTSGYSQRRSYSDDREYGRSSSSSSSSGRSRYNRNVYRDDDSDDDKESKANDDKDDRRKDAEPETEDNDLTPSTCKIVARGKEKTKLRSESADSVHTPTRKNKLNVSKKIDLGAAADYAKQHESQRQTSISSSSKARKSGADVAQASDSVNDLLFDLDANVSTSNVIAGNVSTRASLIPDLFDTSAANANVASSSSVLIDTGGVATTTTTGLTGDDNDEFTEFADFTTFASSSVTEVGKSMTPTAHVSSTGGDEEFGDFESAFGTSSSNSIQPAIVVKDTTIQSPMSSNNELSDLFGGPTTSGFPAASSVHMVASTSSSSNIDLLAGIDSPMVTSPVPNSSSMNQILIPSASPTLLEASPSRSQSKECKSTGKTVELNESWSKLTKNLNINLDNLLEAKTEKPKPSMNQLAAKKK